MAPERVRVRAGEHGQSSEGGGRSAAQQGDAGEQPHWYVVLEVIGQRLNSIFIFPVKSENCVTFSG